MKPIMSKPHLLQASFLTVFFLTLLLHGTPVTRLFTLFTQNLTLSLSLTWCLLLSSYYYYTTRPHKVLLLDYTCHKPNFDRKCSYEAAYYIVLRSKRFNTVSEEFMRGIYLKSGLGDETYVPPFIFKNDYEATLTSALDEAKESMFSAVDALLLKTQISPDLIDIVIVTCGCFSPSPSLSSLLVNRYKFKPGIKTFNLSGMGCSSGALSVDLAAKMLGIGKKSRYALVVITENISSNWYFGNNRSMLVTNCIFRVGCAATIITNDSAQRSSAKMELITSLRTHHGADDSAYNAAIQQEDEKGSIGITLTKDLIRVAGMGLKEHITVLAPRVLPLSQLVAYAYSLMVSFLSRDEKKHIVPDFTTAFEHMCIHTGGKAVIQQVGRVLNLGEDVTEPAQMSLHRFGNTSSSLVFYELAYFEAKERVKKGDKLWMLAFGTGFKVCGLVFKSLRDSVNEGDNPWNDCIHRYPVKAW